MSDQYNYAGISGTVREFFIGDGVSGPFDVPANWPEGDEMTTAAAYAITMMEHAFDLGADSLMIFMEDANPRFGDAVYRTPTFVADNRKQGREIICTLDRAGPWGGGGR